MHKQRLGYWAMGLSAAVMVTMSGCAKEPVNTAMYYGHSLYQGMESVCIFSPSSELPLALEIQTLMAKRDIGARITSLEPQVKNQCPQRLSFEVDRTQTPGVALMTLQYVNLRSGLSLYVKDRASMFPAQQVGLAQTRMDNPKEVLASMIDRLFPERAH